MDITFMLIDESGNELTHYRDTVKNVLPKQIYFMLDEYLKVLAENAWDNNETDFYKEHAFCTAIAQISFSGGYGNKTVVPVAHYFYPDRIVYRGKEEYVTWLAHISENPIIVKVIMEDKSHIRVQWDREKEQWIPMKSIPMKSAS